ncbi:MAG: hypothetical protein QM747_12420 [Nocardioides sp.]
MKGDSQQRAGFALHRLRRNRWFVRLMLVVLGVALLSVGAAIEHTHPKIVPTVLFVAAVVAVLGLLADSSGADASDWSQVAEHTAASTGQDAPLAGNVRLIENHLTSREVDRHLQTRLTRMTDNRLSQLGLTRRDPGVAQRLGPTLTAVLDGPPRVLKLAEIDECIRRIEELSP